MSSTPPWSFLAGDGDHIVTFDPNDLGLLAALAGRHVELIRA
jgi:hypothetical protein